MTEEQKEKKGPFSPLQSGCAFVMLTNMLLYLGVVAFVFNLLDPSKIDKDYLARRTFTAEREEETAQEKEFRQISEKKKKEQTKAQEEMLDTDGRRDSLKKETVAGELSQLDERHHDSVLHGRPEFPKAALTESSIRGGTHTSTRTAKTRQYSISIFPQATLRRLYSPYNLPAGKTIIPERYDTLPVEIAPGIDFPSFQLPTPGDEIRGLYTPSSGLPPVSRGGLHLKAPSAGAQKFEKNEPETLEKPADENDDL